MIEQKIRRGCDPEKRRVGGSCDSEVMGVVTLLQEFSMYFVTWGKLVLKFRKIVRASMIR